MIRYDKDRREYSESDPDVIYKQYMRGVSYNDSLDLYRSIKRSENFFLGKQWEGVNAPDMDKPVFNILKRVINYFIAMLVSDNVAVSLSLFNKKPDSVARISLQIFEDELERIMEYNKFGRLMRYILRDAAVDGDGCLHIYFDNDVSSGQNGEKGIIRAECVDNTAVFFGDTGTNETERQPYIIIEQRRLLRDVKERLINDGRKADAESLTPDMPQFEEDDAGDGCARVTLLTKYWKHNGHVMYAQSTKDMLIKDAVDTGLRMYPVCFMNWERVKGSYHGASVTEGLIPNQIAINKMAALAQQFIKQQAFPRIFYNENKLKSWVGGVKPVAVQGDPSDIIYTDKHNTSMSAQVNQYFEEFIGYTKDLMGASDAALGSVNPNNTSAIIAVQQATAVPLELVKQEYYQFVEDFVRIALDNMRAFYGQRTVLVKDDADEWQEVPFDFSILNDYVLRLKADVGASAYWSELTNTTTLSNLFESGLIEPVTYLESIPEGQLPQKNRIVSEAKVRLEKQEAENAGAASGETL